MAIPTICIFYLYYYAPTDTSMDLFFALIVVILVMQTIYRAMLELQYQEPIKSKFEQSLKEIRKIIGEKDCPECGLFGLPVNPYINELDRDYEHDLYDDDDDSYEQIMVAIDYDCSNGKNDYIGKIDIQSNNHTTSLSTYECSSDEINTCYNSCSNEDSQCSGLIKEINDNSNYNNKNNNNNNNNNKNDKSIPNYNNSEIGFINNEASLITKKSLKKSKSHKSETTTTTTTTTSLSKTKTKAKRI
eukprot:Pgem_evm1s3677